MNRGESWRALLCDHLAGRRSPASTLGFTAGSTVLIFGLVWAWLDHVSMNMRSSMLTGGLVLLLLLNAAVGMVAVFRATRRLRLLAGASWRTAAVMLVLVAAWPALYVSPFGVPRALAPDVLLEQPEFEAGRGHTHGTPDDALRSALVREDLAAVEAALRDGADPNAVLGAQALRPLHLSAQGGHVEIIRVLVAHGADLEARTTQGTTPLAAAVLGEQVAAVEVLLALGADPQASNTFGDTPVDLARDAGKPEIRRLFGL